MLKVKGNNRNGKEGRRRHDFKQKLKGLYSFCSARLSRWSCDDSAAGGKSVAAHDVAAATAAVTGDAAGYCGCSRGQ